MPKRLLTIKETAILLKVNEALVYNLIKQKKLIALKIGRSFRISEKSLKQFLKIKKIVPLYPLSETSKILKINKLTLYRFAKQRKIKTIKIGRFFRIAGETAFNYSLSQKFFTISETARFFKVNPVSVRKLVLAKKLFSIKLGQLYRIPEKEILKFTGQKQIKPVLDIKDVEKTLKLSRLTILKLIASGELAAFKIGKLYRITALALSLYEKAQKEIYTVFKLASLLKVSASLIRKMIKRGEIKAKKIGREYQIRPEEIKKLLK